MKNKFVDVVFKKFQSYSFIIFLALVLGAFFALAQLNKEKPVEDPDVTDVVTNPDNSGVVKVEDEMFIMPMSETLNPQVARIFYELNGTNEEQESALIIYQNYIFHNDGTNYTVDKTAEFDVLASLSGTVTKVREDITLGWVVEVEHLYGVKTLYNSLSSVNVAVGDTVAQGDVLGTAGSNEFDTESGVHVHFEIIQGKTRFNPQNMIGTGIAQFKPQTE